MGAGRAGQLDDPGQLAIPPRLWCDGRREADGQSQPPRPPQPAQGALEQPRRAAEAVVLLGVGGVDADEDAVQAGPLQLHRSPLQRPAVGEQEHGGQVLVDRADQFR